MIQNPILKGFCPDPSVIRVGGDYYIATSTFEWWPGVKLFHSRDLKHWEQIPSPLRRKSQLNMQGNPPSGGIWAPCLSYDGQYYYLVYTDVKTKKGRYYNTHNYLVYTDDIYGEWSEPLYLNSIGFDPSLFHDTDGKKYLVNMVNGFKGVLVQELAPAREEEQQESADKNRADTFRSECPPPFRLVGERKKVYDGSGIGCTEGPHLYHVGDWYYLLTAEGGTGYEHCVTMARAGSVWGPFETDPENPVLTSEKEDLRSLQKCGHADLVDTPEGEWYMVHLCARPLSEQKWCTLGRETAIQKVYWNTDGWLRLSVGGRYARKLTPETGEEEQAAGTPEMAGKSGAALAEREIRPNPQSIHDDFDRPELPLHYSSPRVSCEGFADLAARPGFLRLRG
ncbi:MAG: glycoside hydrolase family 43 protein, partial [Lachnospiraceae bacterium]|nr:glycoside hydrolase family 43 protein [Lachnospiraceae bacterium]